MNKQFRNVIKGMQQDLDISKCGNEFSYENKNIRITATKDSAFLAISNEKGLTKIHQVSSNRNILGCNSINNKVVIFKSIKFYASNIITILQTLSIYSSSPLPSYKTKKPPKHPI